MLGLIESLFVLSFLLLALVGTVFWVWMLVECATREPDLGNQKLTWILIILFSHLIGALIYFFVRRPQRLAEVGR
jgi:hypothetical protein